MLRKGVGAARRRYLEFERARDRKRFERVGLEETTLRPVEIIRETFRAVVEALDAEGVEWWLISTETDPKSRVGVHHDDRHLVLRALDGLGQSGYWGSNPRARAVGARAFELSRAKSQRILASLDVVAVFKPHTFGGPDALVTSSYACDIEFWATEEINGREYVVAPRENRAAATLSLDDFAPTVTEWHGLTVKTPNVMTRRMLDDVRFDIDVVYTWVDGSDPEWRARRARAEGTEETYHPEATMDSRFTHRDELRYSMRSLEYFAPWVRKVYLVTDRQVPSWLNTENPRLEVVDHTAIFTRPEDLPCFNSNSIISNLHHIDGLSEHYIYMNDDVFLGRLVTPELFFLPTGAARISPSNNRRMFGDPSADDEPHFNITRNIRGLIEDEFGITVSRAIRHTPHPQIRSVHYEMEERFASAYENTWSHPFRHHTDIVSDQLFHYYAQIVGKAMPAPFPYTYINVMDGRHAERLDALLAQRRRAAFCINDAPVEGEDPIDPQRVQEFFDSYFPVRSSFER